MTAPAEILIADDHALFRKGFGLLLRDALPGGLYAVDFVGRRTAQGTPYVGAEADIIVDRLISIRQVESPPK